MLRVLLFSRVKIGVIDVSEREGGVRTFIDNFSKALRRQGYIVKTIDFERASVGELNSFDILHFSNPFLRSVDRSILKYVWKLLFTRHPRKVLTVHGWVRKEILYTRSQNWRRSADSGAIVSVLLKFLMWKLVPLFFDSITCPTTRTANENKLKNAFVISNAIFPEYYSSIDPVDLSMKTSEVLFVTYVSIGGLKNVALNRTIRVVRKLNKILKSKKVKLLVFGKDYYGRSRYPYVQIMGYSSKFLSILKSAALFITGKTFPDLGYAEMEAGILGTPVAKFTEDYETEEIIDGQTGILAKNEEEMVNKLLDYVSDLENNKQKLGNSFREYVTKNKNWSSVIGQWNEVFMNCLCARAIDREEKCDDPTCSSGKPNQDLS